MTMIRAPLLAALALAASMRARGRQFEPHSGIA
jgi:hypothetical protein